MYACSTTARSTASTSTGERVDWAPLSDGDEIAIGRHTIHYFDTATVGSGASAPAAVAE